MYQSRDISGFDPAKWLESDQPNSEGRDSDSTLELTVFSVLSGDNTQVFNIFKCPQKILLFPQYPIEQFP